MCLGCPKHPRSSRNSKVDRRSARTKAVQNVRSQRPPWHVVACALTRACNDASSSAHPNRLASPHCTQAQIPHRCNPQHTHAQDPTTSQHAQMCASNDKATWQHTKWSAQLQPLPRATCALEAHRFGPFGPSGAAHAPPFDSIATRISTASRTPASYS